jgi:hypothetical protein
MPSLDFYSLIGILCVIVALALFVVVVWTRRNV